MQQILFHHTLSDQHTWYANIRYVIGKSSFFCIPNWRMRIVSFILKTSQYRKIICAHFVRKIANWFKSPCLQFEPPSDIALHSSSNPEAPMRTNSEYMKAPLAFYALKSCTKMIDFKHQINILLFGLVASNAKVMTLFIFSHVFKLNMKAGIKCMEEIVLLRVNMVADGRPYSWQQSLHHSMEVGNTRHSYQKMSVSTSTPTSGHVIPIRLQIPWLFSAGRCCASDQQKTWST